MCSNTNRPSYYALPGALTTVSCEPSDIHTVTDGFHFVVMSPPLGLFLVALDTTAPGSLKFSSFMALDGAQLSRFFLW